MVDSIYSFIHALLKNWVVLMTGCLITAVLGVIEKWTRKTLSWKFYKWLILLLVFFACFLTWNDGHAKVIQLEKQKIASRPNLIGQIDRYYVFPYRKQEKDSILILEARIKNIGAPSIVEDIHILIKKGDKTIEGKHILPPSQKLDFTGKNEDGSKYSLTLKTEDYLPRKLVSETIQTGGQVGGFFFILVKGLSKNQISSTGTTFIFSFRDAFENLYNYQSFFGGPFEVITPDRLQ